MRWVGTVLGVALYLSIVGGVSHATDFDTVTVNPTGPTKAIPTDASFYLGGPVTLSVDRVQVFILRTGSPTVFANHGLSCATVISRLSNGSNQPVLINDSDVLPSVAPGSAPANSIWKYGDSSWDVKVLRPWVADRSKPLDPTKPVSFSVLVEKDADFFSAGHGFCFFLYEQTGVATTTPDAELAAAIFAVIAHYLACPSNCTIERQRIDELLATHILDAEARAKAKAQIEDSLSDAFKLQRSWNAVVGILRNWTSAINTTGKAPNLDAAIATQVNPVPPALSDTQLTMKIAGTDVTLEDVQELQQQQFVVGRRAYSPVALANALDAAFNSSINADGKVDVTVIADAITTFERLQTALAKIHQLPAANLFAQWADGIKVPCAESSQRLWQLPSFKCVSANSGWDTYPAADPLELLAFHLDQVQRAAAKWATERPKIQTTLVKTELFTAPFSTSVEMTRELWVFSYISPVIGYALTIADRNGKSEPITLHYYGAQLHMRPNPSHKPELDLGMLALELGTTPGIGSFGPDNRFRGFRGIAPIFIGLAIHPLPYTSLSGGFMFADKRSTSLSQEDFGTYCGGYIGISVDLNIPEAVRSLSDKTSTTSAASVKN